MPLAHFLSIDSIASISAFKRILFILMLVQHNSMAYAPKSFKATWRKFATLTLLRFQFQIAEIVTSLKSCIFILYIDRDANNSCKPIWNPVSRLI